MSSIAKKFFIASLIYLVFGLLSQAVAVFDVWLGFNPLAYTAITATEQILLVGWLTQLALALIYDHWLSPIQNQKPILPVLSETEGPKIQNPKSPMVIFLLFNIGLPLVIIGQPGLALFGGRWLGAAAAFGGLLQFFAGLLFVYEVWRTLKR